MISTEINRISRAKRDIREALDLIKIKIPVEEKLDKYPKYIRFPDYKSQPLTFEFLGSGTDQISYFGDPHDMYYSKNYGKTWIELDDALEVSGGDVVMLKGTMRNNNEYGSGNSVLYFPSHLNYNVSGNIASLVYASNFANQTTFPGDVTASGFFNAFFMRSNIISAENLILPFMSYGCYTQLFFNSSLVIPPKLPATALAEYCYAYMFSGCTNLTTAPVLPATILEDYCYEGMFDGCTSLTTAPVLPAATLVNYCYYCMFENCSSLNYIKCLATNISASNCTTYWVSGVAQTGLFEKAEGMTDWEVDSIDGIPDGWTARDVEHDYSHDYLTLEFTGSGSDTLAYNGTGPMYYSSDNGQTWDSLGYLTVNTGDVIMIKGSLDSPGNWFGSLTAFEFPRYIEFNVYGNIASLLSPTNFENITAVPDESWFYKLFWYASVVSAENLVLPFTELTYDCYGCMFEDCTSLTTAPKILPATTLANGCYYEMFSGCSALINPPKLPATTLAEYCYKWMFYDCTSLTTAPELLATTLVTNCYQLMFDGCNNLNYVKCLAINIIGSGCTNYWLSNVAQTGTFVKNPNMTSWQTGTSSGIPYGWTVVDYYPDDGSDSESE